MHPPSHRGPFGDRSGRDSRQDSRALAARTRAGAGLSRAPLRPGDSHRLPRLSSTGRPRGAPATGIPVLWYIAPQMWGWRPGRAARFARVVDRLAVILPFERRFFRARPASTRRLSVTRCSTASRRRPAAARRQLGPAGRREGAGASFPGRAAGEVRRLWPVMRDAARPCSRGCCAACGRRGHARGASIPAPTASRSCATTRRACSRPLTRCIAKSGTTTLQAALADVPMVVAYSINAIVGAADAPTADVALGRAAESDRRTGDRTRTAAGAAHRRRARRGCVRPLLDPASSAAHEQRDGLAEVRRRLGGPGASARVAQLAGELLAA